MMKRVEPYIGLLVKGGRKQYIATNRAREIIKNIHRPQGRACRKDGINAIVKCFSQQYDCKGVRKMVQDVKANCDGTCKKMAALKTRKPPPKLMCTFKVMERVHIDLLEMYGSQSPFVQQSSHSFRLILSVMDYFSNTVGLFYSPPRPQQWYQRPCKIYSPSMAAQKNCNLITVVNL